MPLQATSGGASYDAFGGGAAAVPTYIEDVFSTWLYTGTSSAQTITNGIDLAGKGGMVWIKSRSNAYNHWVVDSARGTGNDKPRLQTNTTAAQSLLASTAFGATGFTVYGDSDYNGNGATFASWTFRKQPKFFDVVTYSGSGAGTQTISHSLGSTPGFIVVKRLNAASNWWAYHRSLPFGDTLRLNLTNAAAANYEFGTVNSTSFEVAANDLCASGGTYVAYLFAHNAGGFGLTGTDNVISCGSFTGPTATVDLGYEPQWLLTKRVDSTGNWTLMDTMRGLVGSSSSGGVFLQPNTSNAENSQGQYTVNATGFNASVGVTSTFIYIAIRRGPMKTPTTGTSVFESIASSGSTGTVQTTGFPVDMQIAGLRTVAGSCDHYVDDRLRGVSSTLTEKGVFLKTNTTDAEATTLNLTRNWGNTGFENPSDLANISAIYWNFRRAPGFFDVVCYTGTGSARTVAHNLGVAPELMIVKSRSVGGVGYDWSVYAAPLGAAKYASLNRDDRAYDDFGGWWNNTAPTASVFSVGTSIHINGSGTTFVNYLFASCPGVSKVGSYTGTGTTQQINCGFTAGARFVLIKRTDSTGDWYVWDSARGIVAGNDPYLMLNSTAAEVTNTDWVDTAATGFELSNAAGNLANINGASYIFLAVS